MTEGIRLDRTPKIPCRIPVNWRDWKYSRGGKQPGDGGPGEVYVQTPVAGISLTARRRMVSATVIGRLTRRRAGFDAYVNPSLGPNLIIYLWWLRLSVRGIIDDITIALHAARDPE